MVNITKCETCGVEREIPDISKFNKMANVAGIVYVDSCDSCKKGIKEEQIKAHRNQFRFLTLIDSKDIQELYEILCEIPFEGSMMIDSEPRNARHPIIESMLDELTERIQESNFREE